MNKQKSGIAGFDRVTYGGLPQGRPTLIAGGPGCGKSLFALSCVSHAADGGSGAVFLSFEEKVEDIIDNARSIGLDLAKRVAEGHLVVDYVPQPEQTTLEVGGYTLDGLFVRLQALVNEVNAKTFCIDTIEILFAMFDNHRLIRKELVRLFEWFKGHDITLLITAEQGDGRMTRYGLEEYVSDCVLFLDHRVSMDISTRRLRIVKFRGAKHGTNEFPFVIDSDGIHVMPVTEAALNHSMPKGFVPTGLDRLDQALGEQGFRKGATVLISGATGSGKTNFTLTMACAAASRGDKTVFFSFEESPEELIHNVLSIGLDIKRYIDAGLLVLQCARPTLQGLEQHLVEMYRRIEKERPALVFVDPLSGLQAAGTREAAYRMLVRLVDMLKQRQITFVGTASHKGEGQEETGLDISAIIDVWVRLFRNKAAADFEKTLEIVKARGVQHETGLIGYAITSDGIRFDTPLADVGLGPAADV